MVTHNPSWRSLVFGAGGAAGIVYGSILYMMDSPHAVFVLLLAIYAQLIAIELLLCDRKKE